MILAYLFVSNKSMFLTLVGVPIIARWYARRRMPWLPVALLIPLMLFVIFPFYNTYRITRAPRPRPRACPRPTTRCRIGTARLTAVGRSGVQAANGVDHVDGGRRSGRRSLGSGGQRRDADDPVPDLHRTASALARQAADDASGESGPDFRVHPRLRSADVRSL